MKFNGARSLLVLGALFLARTVHAQPGCEFMYCSIDAWYDSQSGKIEGYSRATLFFAPVYLDTWVGNTQLQGEYGFGSAEKQIDFTPSDYGQTYNVSSEYYYYWGSPAWWWDDGWAEVNVYVPPLEPWPTGESSEAIGTFQMAGRFNGLISPADANYYGRYVWESAYLPDGCWWPDSLVISPINITGNDGWIVGWPANIYGVDNVGLTGPEAVDVVEFYISMVPLRGSCGWTGFQIMSMSPSGLYAGGQYAINSLGLVVGITGAYAYRADATQVVY